MSAPSVPAIKAPASSAHEVAVTVPFIEAEVPFSYENSEQRLICF
jgi:hypothetical protein